MDPIQLSLKVNHGRVFVGRLLTVCAGAQRGGTALLRRRSLDTNELLAIIDISVLAPAEEN